MSTPFINKTAGKSKVLPPVAGGSPEPGERLCSDTKYMDEQPAKAVHGWVNSWRRMTPQEFDDFASRL